MKQFSNEDIDKLDGEEKYWFEAGMISACKPAFDKCDSNYGVEKVLREAGVIRKNNRTDTESSALVVNFSSRSAGEAFIQRLNTYLSDMDPKIQAAMRQADHLMGAR